MLLISNHFTTTASSSFRLSLYLQWWVDTLWLCLQVVYVVGILHTTQSGDRHDEMGFLSTMDVSIFSVLLTFSILWCDQHYNHKALLFSYSVLMTNEFSICIFTVDYPSHMPLLNMLPNPLK